jgi:hypothetical protein
MLDYSTILSRVVLSLLIAPWGTRAIAGDTAPLASSPAAQAQMFRLPAGVIQNVRFEELGNGTLRITYDLVSDDPQAAFFVALEISTDGGASFTPAGPAEGDVGAHIRPGVGKVVTWRAGPSAGELAAHPFRIVARASRGNVTSVSAPPSPVGGTADGAMPRRWHVGTLVSASMEPRMTTALLGSHQALGGALTVGIPLAARVEAGIEANASLWRSALDTTHGALTAEQRYLQDTFLVGTLAYSAPLTRRAEVLFLGGGGMALLRTYRHRYSVVGSSVRTVTDDSFTATSTLTTGADVRLMIATRVAVVANYRLYVLAGAGNWELERGRLQHRPGIGVVMSLGGRR